MSARWNSNTVLLAVFILILVGAGVDYGRRVLGGDNPPPTLEDPITKRGMKPDFKVGDLAPDFALPDDKKKMHKLSELVKKKTMLFFACGCSNCKDVQTWLADMREKRKDDFPPVITITSAPPESEAAWLRDTGLPQEMLFWSAAASPDPMAIYKGKPCPRIYVVNSDRTVKFIGTSMAESPGVQSIGYEILKELGFGAASSPEAMHKLMGDKAKMAPLPKAQPVAVPSLPPYAQPQSALPGGER